MAVCCERKLIQITGYSSARPTIKVVTQSGIVKLEKSIFKSFAYIRVDKYSDVPVHLVYSDSIPRNAPVLIFLAGSTSGVHVGWGGSKVPADHEKLFMWIRHSLESCKRWFPGCWYRTTRLWGAPGDALKQKI